jgi:surface antigen
MPLPRGRRRGRRIVGGMILLGLAVTTVGLVPSLDSAYASGDDYPYRGLGSCPLVPLPPPPDPPVKPGGPGRPGAPTRPGVSAGTPGHPGPGHAGPTKPVAPQPPPPRTCAKHIWFYNGSYGDPWGFALRNCTSFVAWRLRETNGVDDFASDMSGAHWGNAADWDEAARYLGYLVDDVPAVGAVAQTDAGSHGHVAWVSAVSDGTVTVEEYNMGVAGGYDVRTVPTGDFRYLHVADVAPAPYLGSTRSAVSTTDAHGGAWTALSTTAGALVVRRPSGLTTHLPGAWSPHASPSVVTDLNGRVWVAGVTPDGRVLTAHVSPATGRLGPARLVATGSATTSSPVLTTEADGGVRLFTVTATGTLLERHTLGPRADRWSHPFRMGRPGSWSTQSAPAVATDPRGRIYLAAVTRGGGLQSQHTVGHGRWSGFHPVDDRTWSVTSSPALAAADDGKVWLATIDDRGGLTVRHTDPQGGRWPAGTSLVGPWSPYASPSLAVDRSGRTWLGAVGEDGQVVVRSAKAGTPTWRPARGLPHVPPAVTSSPTLAATPDGGVLIGVTDGQGRALWRRPSGPATLPAAHGPHGGGFTVSPLL